MCPCRLIDCEGALDQWEASFFVVVRAGVGPEPITTIFYSLEMGGAAAWQPRIALCPGSPRAWLNILHLKSLIFLHSPPADCGGWDSLSVLEN